MDKEFDSSSLSKVAKVGAAALAVGVGAASFNNSALSRQLKSEILPALNGAKKTALKSLRDNKAIRKGLDKRTTGKDIKEALQLSKKSFKEATAELKAKNKLRLDSSRKNNFLGATKHFEQIKTSDVIYGLRDNLKSELKKDNVFKLVNKHKDKNSKAVTAIANEAYEKIRQNTLKNKETGEIGFSDFLSKRFRKAGFSKEEETEFLKNIYDHLEEIDERVKNGDGISSQLKSKLDREFEKTLQESKKYSDTTFGKFDKLVKKVSGVDINSEKIFTGSRAATLGDIKQALKENPDIFEDKDFQFNIRTLNGQTIKKDFRDIIKNMDLDDNIIFDKAIRVDKDGTLFSDAAWRNVKDDMFRGFSDSTLGNIFGLTDVRLNNDKAAFATFRALSTGKEAAYEAGNDAGNTILMNSKIAISNPTTGKARLYETVLNENGEMVLSNEIAEGVLRNNMHGKSARLNKEIIGTNKDLISTSDNKILKALDLEQTGSPNIFTKIKSKFRPKDEDYSKNIIKRQKKFFTNDDLAENKIVEEARGYLFEQGIEITDENILKAESEISSRMLKDNIEISKMLNSVTAMNQITDDSIASLIKSGNITDEKSLHLLKLLNDKNYNSAEELLTEIPKNSNLFFNKDLENIVNRGLANSDYIENLQNISQTNLGGFLGYSPGEATNVIGVEDIVRREILKEVIIRESGGGTKAGIANLENVLQNSNLTPEQSKNLRFLANWSIMQTNMHLSNDLDADIKLTDAIDHLKNFDDLLATSGSFNKGYIDMLDDLGARTNLFENTIGNINETYINEYNKYSFMKKSTALNLDQIRSINDAIKSAGDIGKELFAGRNNLNDYTTLTQIPQFMVARLSWGVESIGLNLSKESTSSTFDYMKNIALKRVLPVAAGIALYDRVNYESENFTGVSVTGAAANAVANIDKASRRLAYATGIGQAIDWFKESSVVADYWTGSTDFQNRDEREEWYKDGYSPVRSGRFWGFGSSNEFRGGNIQYWQPNYLKRAHSNYHEVSLYGSADEKFAHSWIPTLSHPFSTLRALWNPYWLEKKHLKEGDRPYPLTGKMFSEGTLWGDILNPTLGELLKPVKMLPEVRRRLGHDGRDAKAVIEELNNKIKHRGKQNKDVLILEGTDIRNARYYAYGNPGDGDINVHIANGKISSPGISYMESLPEIDKKFVPTGKVIEQNESGQYVDNIVHENNIIAQAISQNDTDSKIVVNGIISGINSAIKSLGKKVGRRDNRVSASYTPSNIPDGSEGTYVYTNLVNQINQRNLQYYDDRSNPGMVDKSLMNNYLNDAKHSLKEMSGIYNFLGELAFKSDGYSFRYANAGAMTSSSRRFWDSAIGGTGGELMEIARRFFPSEDKSIINYNPLRNTMPEWLPERFLTGDPFTSLPKGEMRLPGKGYETLNELHPDQFGEYGAFDRFKILADIAPTSEEYKLWRNIARNTVTDPELIKQMQEIQSRTVRQSGKHEFYKYRYIKNDVEMKKGVVKSVNGSIVELQSGEQLNLGGIKLSEGADIGELLHAGEHINYRTNANAIKRLEDGLVTNAVIYKIGENGGNVNKQLVTMGMAEKDNDDRTAIGYLANAGAMQQTIGSIQELIAHAPIPILHNKWMKIETARESFLNEQVYGSSFSTWDHPIKGFIRPAINRSSQQSLLMHTLATGSAALFLNIDKLTSKTHLKYLAGGLTALTNPSAFLGMTAAGIWDLGLKVTGTSSKKTNIELGAGIGAAIGSAAWAWNNAENPLKAASGFALAGYSAARWFKLSELGLKDSKVAMIGAGIGLGISALKNSRMNKDMFRRKWIPKETEKKFEMDEYFDRLEYLKYEGLYNQAALRATIFEGSNIKSIYKKIDKNKKKIAKIQRKAEKLSNSVISEGLKYNKLMNKYNAKIQALEAQQTVLKGGKYTKAAIAYKKAMESTVYGLSEGATQDEILAAVPDQYKDYFMDFMNETDKKERKKILKTLPEYLRRPLQVAWNEKVDRVQSNNKYFKKHKLPGLGWKGWKPNVNLKHVKMKTIQNEGMLLSDFGYYESEKSKEQYQMAPTINNINKGKSGIKHLADMKSALSGLGVSVQNISVEPTSAPGLWIVGDIRQTVGDVFKVGQYEVASGINGLTSLLF